MTDKYESADSTVALLYEITAVLREEVGMNEAFAAQFAAAIARGLRRRCGADYLYVPATDRTERDALIVAEFDGTNRDQVCKKYNISKSRLYQIVGK